MLIWSKKDKQTLYEVRSAGRVRRLYTNGVMHSQIHLDKPLTSYVWDLLMLPAFYYPPREINRVLVLGVGGGSVIRSLNYFFKPREVVAVELNPVHIHVAKKYFRTIDANVKIVCDDAKQFVENYRGEDFDVIIDDLFGEGWRAVQVDSTWLKKLSALLSAGGFMSFNFTEPKELKQSALLQSLGKKLFHSRFRMTSPAEDNIVVAGMQKKIDTRDLRHILRKDSRVTRALGKLNYNIRRLD